MEQPIASQPESFNLIFQIMKQPYNITIAAGQTALLWSGTKVLIKKTYTTESRIYTAWESFVGTEAEVAAKIAELKLTDLPAPKSPATAKA
jgi:hypothetical protein